MQTLAQAVKGKHPEYKDWDDAELEKAIKAKYPGMYDDWDTTPETPKARVSSLTGMERPQTTLPSWMTAGRDASMQITPEDMATGASIAGMAIPAVGAARAALAAPSMLSGAAAIGRAAVPLVAGAAVHEGARRVGVPWYVAEPLAAAAGLATGGRSLLRTLLKRSLDESEVVAARGMRVPGSSSSGIPAVSVPVKPAPTSMTIERPVVPKTAIASQQVMSAEARAAESAVPSPTPQPPPAVPASSAPARPQRTRPAASSRAGGQSKSPALGRADLTKEELAALEGELANGKHSEEVILEHLQRIRTQTAAPAAKAPSKPAPKPRATVKPSSGQASNFNAWEVNEYHRLIKLGKSPAEATELIRQSQEFAKRMGLESSTTVQRKIADRNVTGKWKDN